MKTIAAAMVQNDSGYGGQSSEERFFTSPSNTSTTSLSLEESSSELWTTALEKKIVLTPKTSSNKSPLGIIEEVDEILAGATSTPKVLDAAKIASMFNKDEESGGLLSAIEVVMLLVVVFSLCYMMTMTLTGERTGGKYAAIQFYHDKLAEPEDEAF